MAAFASTDVTVAITDRRVMGRKMMVVGTITFGDGALTYPTAGIPLPAIATFGLRRNMDSLQVDGINGITTDYVTGYNKAAHKLQLFENSAAAGPFGEADTAEAPLARTYYFTAWGW